MTRPPATLAIWLTALLLLASASASSPARPTPESILEGCVQSCDCYPQATPRRATAATLAVDVECSNADDLPPIFPAGTQRLRVSGIRANALRTQLHHASLRKLRDLDLAGNGIREVAVDAFHRLPELKLIDLSDNAIVALSAQHFAEQRNLDLLIVSGNPGLDCVALRREMALICVKCDADDAPCQRPTRGPTGARSPRPEIDTNNSEIVPEIASNAAEVAPEVAPGVTPTPGRRNDSAVHAPAEVPACPSAWLWVGLGVVIGAIIGAALTHMLTRMLGTKAQKRKSEESAPLDEGDREG